VIARPRLGCRGVCANAFSVLAAASTGTRAVFV
jgi:hypothetical protein